MPVLGLIVAQITALIAGGLLMAALDWWRMPLGLLVPTAWLVGTGALAAERLLLSQAGMTWTLLTVSLPWLPVALLAAWRLRAPLQGIGFRRMRGWWSSLSRSERLALAIEAAVALVIAMWALALLHKTFAQPLVGWDALVVWVFKGRVFYQASGIPAGYLTDPYYATFNHLDYPLLVPLTVARIYSWAGDQDMIVKGWWSLLVGASASGLYFGLSGLVSRVARLAGTLFVIGMPAVMLYGVDGLAGYAEMPLAVFFLFGALFLYRWLCGFSSRGRLALEDPRATNHNPQSEGWQEFGLAAFFFGMAGFTKNEGMVITVAGIGLLLMLTLLLRKFNWAQVSLALGISAILVVPWEVEKALLGVTGDLHPSIGDAISHWSARIGTIAGDLAFQMSRVDVLGLAWLVLPILSLAALLFVPRRWLATVPLLLLVLAHLGGTIIAYLTTPYDLVWHLNNSADRLMFQPTLVVVLLGTIYAGQLLDLRSEGLGSKVQEATSSPDYVAY